MLGSSTRSPASCGASIGGTPADEGSPGGVAGDAAICAATCSTGTAYDGTTRRGSQTSMARLLSITVSSPSTARTRLSVGS